MQIMIISTVPYEPNGITAVIRSLYANGLFSKDRLVFVVPAGSDEACCRELTQWGHTVLFARNRNRNPLGYMTFLKKAMKENKVELVHIHGNSGTCVTELAAAVWAGVPHRVLHAHSSTCNSIALHRVLQPMLNRLTTVGLACSREAGAFMFGHREIQVLANGIPVEEFVFDPDLRRQYRERYGLSNQVVLGHVGTFSQLKNQGFLVDVLAQWRRRGVDAVLVLVGDGPLRESVAQKAMDLGVGEQVIFTGACNGTQEILNLFDYFLFPSLSEGFGIAPVEAQANGLPVIAAQGRMPEAVRIHDKFRFVPLEAGAAGWCDALDALSPVRCPDGADLVRRRGFDRMDAVTQMRQMFLNLCE